MKIAIKTIAVAAAALVMTGCASVSSPVGNGLFITNVQGPITVTEATEVSKEGQACSSNILGLFAMGDSSVDTAKNKADIQTVSSVDHTSFSALGLFSQFCTVVKGS